MTQTLREASLQILRLLSEGWRWRMTPTGGVAHAVKRGQSLSLCGAGVMGWLRAVVTPLLSRKQHVGTQFCQRCAGRIVRDAQDRLAA